MLRRTIPYNLSRRPQLDGPRFAARLVLLPAAIALFVLLGMRQLDRVADADARTPARLSGEQALPRLQAESQRLQNDINGHKQRWSGRVKWANDLIARKTFDFLSRLDFLERHIPDGVQVVALTLSGRSRRTISLTAATPSFSRLLELYRRLAPYKLAITNESSLQGIYQVILRVEFPGEKN